MRNGEVAVDVVSKQTSKQTEINNRRETESETRNTGKYQNTRVTDWRLRVGMLRGFVVV